MSRQIIDQETAEETCDLMVNTFWGGTARGECVQLTVVGKLQNEGYSQMKREEAIKFFAMVLARLMNQAKEDGENPPWWQEVAKSMEKDKINNIK